MSDEFDGFLICPGSSKKQKNQFKRMFARDNLKYVPKEKYYLQMRSVDSRHQIYALDVTVNKMNVGHFSVGIIDPIPLSIEVYKGINEVAEKLFREETMYGIGDYEGLDRINNSIMTGFGGRELYPTITEKAAALWYKIATNQVFRNGNKRTALLAAIYFMGINFYTFDVCNGNEMYDMSVRAANKQISQNQIERYISEHVSLGYENMSAVINGGDFKLNVKIEINNSEE
jgi:death-on-curing family protein